MIGAHAAACSEGVEELILRRSAQTLSAGTEPLDQRSIFSARRIDASRRPPSISQIQLALLGERPSCAAACSSVSP